MGYTNKDTFRNSYSKNRRKKSEYAMPVSYTHLDVYKRQPYKGKGIKYAEEHIRRKEGKAGKK